MHYKNGRIAQNGDKLVIFPTYGPPAIGILYDATAGNDFCNGKVAVIAPNDPIANLSECLHFDDVKAALGDIEAVVDSTQPRPFLDKPAAHR